VLQDNAISSSPSVQDDLLSSAYIAFLYCMRGNQEYPFDIRQVQELRAHFAVTRLSYIPDFLTILAALTDRIPDSDRTKGFHALDQYGP